MSPTPSRFVRLARWCNGHRLQTFLLFLAAGIAFQVTAGVVGKSDSASFRLPGTESQRAYDLLADHFPAQKGDSDQAVFKAKTGTLDDPVNKKAIDDTIAKIKKQSIVASVVSPFDQNGQITEDHKIGVAQVNYKDTLDDDALDALKDIQDDITGAASTTLQAEHGGQGGEFARQGGGGIAELVGILAAAIVLFLVFGSLIAMGIPLLSTILALVSSTGAIVLLGHIVETPDFASQISVLIGLGVGIDYALFVVSRYRSEVKAGMDRDRAIEAAIDTAGRTVMFAAITVIIALLGLLLLGLSFMRGVGIGAAATVLATMFAALTLIPALVGAAGDKMDGITARARERYRSKGSDGHRWESWSRLVQKRPWPAATLALVVLVAMMIPLTGMRLASSDASTDPPDSTTGKAYDLIAEGFGPGVNGTFLLVADLPKKGDKAAADQVAKAVSDSKQFASVAPAALSPDGEVATIVATPRTGPQNERTTTVLNDLRDDVLPPVERATGAKVEVGGFTASGVDFSDVVASKLPIFIGAVVLLSALLLMAVFRSVFIPIKAALMNLLSIGASLGIVTLVFQEGVGAGLLGIDSGPIDSFAPVMFFAIVFGLSMDYEVFLVSRIHEDWEKTKDAEGAVARGLAATGRIITAAAAIMILVFLSFGLAPDRIVKLFGLGLATAVFVDAVLIRCLLVPAVMEIAGRRAWWLPAWLDRILPKLAIESEADHVPRAASAPGQPATDVA